VRSAGGAGRGVVGTVRGGRRVVDGVVRGIHDVDPFLEGEAVGVGGSDLDHDALFNLMNCDIDGVHVDDEGSFHLFNGTLSRLQSKLDRDHLVEGHPVGDKDESVVHSLGKLAVEENSEG